MSADRWREEYARTCTCCQGRGTEPNGAECVDCEGEGVMVYGEICKHERQG